MQLSSALGLGPKAMVAFVGAGGKKTAMRQLTLEGLRQGHRVGYTTTTKMPVPSGMTVHVGRPETIPDAIERPVALGAERVENPDRVDAKLDGYTPSVLCDAPIRDRFDWLMVKADGARQKELTAPAAHEPVIPGGATHVGVVASVRAVGVPVESELIHRSERISAITGLSSDTPLTTTAIGTLLASPQGVCADIDPTMTGVPIVNKADTEALCRRARSVVRTAIDLRDQFDWGLITSFRTGHLERVEAGGEQAGSRVGV
ncbi:selenium cofactor biosynthesis protein YqeC [Halocatena halophila]|uniref:selenium cofactor biosynthesis protein YqeC n=1 Tax=Halocatena halophila TaxID=2814576 RepID=UPI002ECFD68D